jgi:hypothetical protein
MQAMTLIQPITNQFAIKLFSQELEEIQPKEMAP